MKRFHCGDVVPGCQASFFARNDEEILRAVGHHARTDHNLSEVPAALVQEVRMRIQEITA